jgi:hypothetical protein
MIKTDSTQAYVNIEVFYIDLREEELKILLNYLCIEAILRNGVFDSWLRHD